MFNQQRNEVGTQLNNKFIKLPYGKPIISHIKTLPLLPTSFILKVLWERII